MATNRHLTDRQSEILDYMRAVQAQYGGPPTIREIMAEFGIESPQGVMCHLNALERKGYLVHRSGGAWVPRTREIACDCPWCGRAVSVTEEYEA